METIKIGKRVFTVLFPDIGLPGQSKDELDGMRKDIRRNGVKTPVVVDEDDGVIDGITRLRIAADVGLASVPVHVLNGLTPEKKRELATALNLHRRHLNGKGKRSAVEALLKTAPEKSDRQIAEEAGVSHTTVGTVREEMESTGQIGQLTERIGADGKKRTATPDRPLCDRCQRTGPAKNCVMCRDLRQPNGTAEKPAAKPKPPAEKPTPKDCNGREIPARCRDAWCDPWITQSIDFLAVVGEKFRQQRLADGMDKRKKHYPFFNPKDFIDGCGMVIATLDQLIEHLKDYGPAFVCGGCDGAGCGACRMSGMLPRVEGGEE